MRCCDNSLRPPRIVVREPALGWIGRKRSRWHVVDVDTVVSEALSRSNLSAEAAGITVTTDHPSGLEVLGDQTLLVTALSNLIENAIAYSPKGSPVSVSRSVRGDNVAIAVTARGEGPAPVLRRRPVPGEQDTPDIGALTCMVEGGE